MTHNIFATQQEALDAQEIDFQLWKANKQHDESCSEEACCGYWEMTTSWATIVEHEGWWIYEICPCGIQTHNQIN